MARTTKDTKTQQAPATQQELQAAGQQQPATTEKKPSASERFTDMVMKQYQSMGAYNFTNRERQLIRNYFICIDQMLQRTEAERLRKNANNRDHKYDNDLPYTWANLDLPELAQDLAHYARVGLDMIEDNTLFPIPFKNTKGNLYTITLMEGYNGIRYQAEKYALDPFRSVTVEVIFENDEFRPIKKDSKNPVEGYEFNIPQPFNRGEPIGVFGYIEFDDPAKNKLLIYSKDDVLKRKPRYASPEFWGGKKKVYENGKPVEVEIEGWVPEMYEKTMKRAIYGSKMIPRDPAKIDESYQFIRRREAQYTEIAIEAEVLENGNQEPLTLPEPEPDSTPAELPEAPAPEAPPAPSPDEPPADLLTGVPAAELPADDTDDTGEVPF
jgi:recombination protein RecT